VASLLDVQQIIVNLEVLVSQTTDPLIKARYREILDQQRTRLALLTEKAKSAGA
jgi:hypothetical protein